MRKFVVPVAAASSFAAAALALAATAAADQTADVVTKNLKDQGYQVQLNQSGGNVPLSRCSVTGIHPSNLDDSAPLQEKQHTLVTIDVVCPHT